MYFELKNIGAIKEAKIELGKLTVICGKNNTGKTYLTYSLFGFLSTLFEHADDFNSLDTFVEFYLERLNEIFSANADEFAGAEFNLVMIGSNQSEFQLNEDLINQFPRPFILPAERTGILLFQKELDKNKTALIKALTKTRHLALLEDNLARFALPIEKDIDFARNCENVIKSNSFLKQEKPELTTYIEEMLGVQYEIIDGQKIVRDKFTHRAMPYYMSSSSVRALFDLHLWLKHQAKKGDILFIDEPELNLHPENQIKMTRLFVKLINSGINLFITTHSSSIIKEFNNLVMLANDFPEKEAMMNGFGYTKDDILHEKDLKAYIAHRDGTVSSVDIDEYGMIQSGFDEFIVQFNETSNKLISAIDNLLDLSNEVTKSY
ncbi:AAA family ATPase [Candidatus Parabeggiatoa sp. HSG14]|uniref:AAA family ATPase n=1 Tax=Candidatus Parabeggiatoa sp. HSG14 TaxID=3055593 RepID=UPI0025A8B85A|nr:AAA family ATPase [Thiotrichales bacterium HSG14]